MLGRTIGNYVIRKKIGEGGMGAVYLAEHTRINRRVAVKLLHPERGSDPQMITRFFREAKATSDIRSEHIVEILDFGELQDGASYLVMEWLEGRPLAQLLLAEPRPPLARTLHIVEGIGHALAAAHARGIVHRDLKPDNVFLVKRAGDPDFAKVLDFGIAKLLPMHSMAEQVRTSSQVVMGTPLYMSPEQCRGDSRLIDQRTDIYALGVILFEMAAGRRPFERDNLTGVLLAHVADPPPAPSGIVPDLPPKVEQAILRALEKDPARRFQTMQEFLTALDLTVPTLLPAPEEPSTLEVIVTSETVQAADRHSGAMAPTAAAPVARSGSQGARVTGQEAFAATTAAAPTPAQNLSTLQSVASEVIPKPRRRAVFGGLAAAGALGLVAVLLLASRPGSQGPLPPSQATQATQVTQAGTTPGVAPPALATVAPSPAPTTAATPTPSPALPAPARVQVRTVPPNAQLTLDGADLPNPFSGELPRGSARRLLVAKAHGYQNESLWAVFDRDQELVLALKPLGSPSRPPPHTPHAPPPAAVAAPTPSPSRPPPQRSQQKNGYQGTNPEIITDYPK